MGKAHRRCKSCYRPRRNQSKATIFAKHRSSSLLSLQRSLGLLVKYLASTDGSEQQHRIDDEEVSSKAPRQAGKRKAQSTQENRGKHPSPWLRAYEFKPGVPSWNSGKKQSDLLNVGKGADRAKPGAKAGQVPWNRGIRMKERVDPDGSPIISRKPGPKPGSIRRSQRDQRRAEGSASMSTGSTSTVKLNRDGSERKRPGPKTVAATPDGQRPPRKPRGEFNKDGTREGRLAQVLGSRDPRQHRKIDSMYRENRCAKRCLQSTSEYFFV